MPHPIHAVVTEHAPRGTDDPCYVPWWAKGAYARKNGTKYTTEEGSTVEAGRVLTEGHGRRSEPEPLSKYRPDPVSVSETPRKVRETPPKVQEDLAAELVATYRTREARAKLCAKYRIDPGILDAPNPGIQSMRLRNALRRVLK